MRSTLRSGLLLTVWLAGCSEYVIDQGDPPATAEPPGVDPDADFGQPPDWNTCSLGYYGQYYNHRIDDGDMAPDEPGPQDPTTVDWWSLDRLAYREYAGSLDLGDNWWPVDEGVEGDPAYFSARWTAWIRAWDGGQLSITLGSATDGWVLIDGDVFAAQPGVHTFAPETFTAQLAAGQYPLDIRSAQRGGEASGFRFRVLEGDVSICYPDFSE